MDSETPTTIDTPTSETPKPTVRVTKIAIQFQTGTFDADGHLIDEGMAPHQITVLWPFGISPLQLQDITRQIEDSLNTPQP